MTVYILVILLSQFWTSSLFHVCSNCFFFTCMQVSHQADQVVWCSCLLKNFPQLAVIHTVEGFSVVTKAEVDVFLEFFCFSYGPTDVDNLIFGSSAFLNPACTCGISLFTCRGSLAWRILNITLLACEMSGTLSWFEYSLAFPFFGLEWQLAFSSPVATAEFSKCVGLLSAALWQHHLLGLEIAQLEFHHFH